MPYTNGMMVFIVLNPDPTTPPPPMAGLGLRRRAYAVFHTPKYQSTKHTTKLNYPTPLQIFATPTHPLNIGRPPT